MIRHYQDISHFRAPYKNATVQGYDGLGVYDFVTHSSPALQGFGEPAPSEKDPRVLINKFYSDPLASNPENIGRVVAWLKTVVGDPDVVDYNRDNFQQPIIETFSTLFEHGGTSAQAKAIVDTTMAWLQNQSNLSKYSAVDATEFLTVLGVMNALVEIGRKQAMLRMMKFNFAPPPPVPPTTTPAGRGDSGFIIPALPPAPVPIVSVSSGRGDPGYVTTSLPPAPVPVVRPTTGGPVIPRPVMGSRTGVVTSRPLTAAEKAAIRGQMPVVYEGARISDGDAAILAEAQRLAEEKAATEKAAEEAKMPSWVLPAAIGTVGLLVAVAILKK